MVQNPAPRALEERRVAPERLAALARLQERLPGRLKRRPLLYATLIAAGFLIANLLGNLLSGAIARAAGADDLSGTIGQLGGDLVTVSCVVWLLSR